MAEPFGTTAPENNPQSLGAFAFNLRFPGQYADQETGLSYNFFRDYDASTGRYAQSDPIGLAGGVNTYAYVNGQPTRYSDPLGLWSPEVHNQIILAYFAGKLSPDLIQAIMDGSADVDAIYNQLPMIGNDYEHAMRAPGQSVSDAKAKACQFIKRHLTEYRIALSSRRPGIKRQAYVHLGMALHTIMDSTSPVHSGYKEWHISDAKQHGNFSSSQENWIHYNDLKRTLDLIERALGGEECACNN
jgi:RHS repeat-associated protein